MRSALLLSLALLACESPETEARPSASASAGRVPPPTRAAAQVVAPARPSANPNPLGLPPRKLDLPSGTLVFAVPEAMLRGAKEGSSFVLQATTVASKDGSDNLIVDGRDGPPYAIHPAYVVPVQSSGRPRLNQPVLAEFAGVLKHGVVRKYVKDKVVVRFTDTVDRGERQLDPSRLVPMVDGFRPGNFAVVRPALASAEAADFEHVLLVSPLGGEAKDASEWLALGALGVAKRVPTSQLSAVPVSYEPKENAKVWVEHLGRMREAVVKDVDRPGLMTVRFARAGRPVQVGWGQVMPPVLPPRAP